MLCICVFAGASVVHVACSMVCNIWVGDGWLFGRK